MAEQMSEYKAPGDFGENWAPGHELIQLLGADAYYVQVAGSHPGGRPRGEATYSKDGVVLTVLEAALVCVGERNVWLVQRNPPSGRDNSLGLREALAMPRE